MFVADCAMLLQTFLESPQLVFHFLDGRIEGGEGGVGFGHRDEFVVMFRPNPQFDAGPLAMFQIDHDTDRGYSIKELSYYFDLLGNFLLRCRAEVTVAGGNSRLHRCYSKCCIDGSLSKGN
jgi:hypothetical protein